MMFGRNILRSLTQQRKSLLPSTRSTPLYTRRHFSNHTNPQPDAQPTDIAMKNAALGGALFLTVYLIYKRSLNIVLEAPDGLDSEEVETIQRELDQEKKWRDEAEKALKEEESK